MAALALLLAAVLLLAPESARADSSATVEAREENGFGRIVLTFDRRPAYRKELEAGVLVLWFEDQIEADIDDIPKDLPQYIGLARLDPDGRAIRLALNRSYLVNLMEAGNELYVDILPPDWKGLPPPLPSHVVKALSRIAAETERKQREEERQREAAKLPYALDVRVVRQPTFARIVFDWNRFVTANMSRQGSQVSVEFGARVKTDIAALKVDPPKYLRGAEMRQTESGTIVLLTVDHDVDVRGFREGQTFLVDLTGPDIAADASTDKLAQALGVQPPDNEGKPPRDVEDKTSLPAQIVAEAEPPKAETPAATAPAELDAADAVAEKLGDAADKQQAQPKAEEPSPAQAEPADRPKPAEARPEAPAEPAKAEAPPPPAATVGTVTVTADDTRGNLRLVVPFAEPVAAAAFRRSHAIWLVFDTDAKLDVSAIRDAVGAKLAGVQHVRSGAMQYIRLQLSRAWLAYAAAQDNAWVVDIGDMVSGKADPLVLTRKLRSDNRSVIGIALEGAGRVHWLTDPDAGDRMAVVTALPPQRMVPKPQDFVEFQALATAHGIAIVPHSDDIAVRQQLDEIIITRRAGLTLSAGNVHQYMAGRKPLAKTARIGFLDVKAWRVADPAVFSNRVHAIQRAVAASPANEKNDKRFTLARLYFANGLTLESLGLLRRMAQIDPALANDPSFNALRGAALTLLGRSAEARKDLAVHALANDGDAALWRGLLDTADKNWEAALHDFDQGADRVRGYGKDLQARFRLAGARAALELKRLARAAEELDAVPRDTGEPALEMERALLRGWYLESIGRAEEAVEAYDRVLKSDRRPAVAEAELRTVAMLLRENKIARADALKQLERMQLVWRGDDVELRTMHLLASLYVKEGQFREAFNTMKNALMTYPEGRLALFIQDEMKQVFKDLFLNGGAQKLKPVEALGLYYDFRELTPVGRQGDEMIRRLADQLIEFDLLDQAAEVLNYQVQKRLKGAARSQVATRLAMVHLMNHKPELALRAIRQTRQAGVPEALRRSRNLLEARALAELGRAEAAIEILNTMEGEEVERLKADAFWTAQQWPKAGEQLEKLLGARWQDPEPLVDRERFDVLRSAISYSLAGDQFALDRVQKKFYEKMVKTRDAESFVVVTRPIMGRGETFRDLAKQIAATNTLDAFMKEFRTRHDPDPATTSAVPKPPREG